MLGIERDTTWAALLFVTASGVLSCGDDTKSSQRCKSDGVLICVCESGRFGEQTCSAGEEPGPCVCDMPGSGGSSAAGGSGGLGAASGGGSGGTSGGSGGSGGSAGTGGMAGAPGALGALLASGTSTLLDVFDGAAGIFVVTSNSISVVDREGSPIRELVAPREITAAAFDGTRLAVFDRAFLKVYDATLTETASASLTEICAAGEIVGSFALCGNEDTFDHVFYAYDLVSGALVKTTPAASAYQGVSMRAVPGTSDFVSTRDGSSPNDFYLYSTNAAGDVASHGDSQYHGDFRVSMVFTFEGNPATHLITEEGLRLSIYAEGCMAGTAFNQACFVRDGQLGTLRGSEHFVGLDQGADGKIYGLADPAAYNTRPLCSQGCLAQRLDPVERVIEAETLYSVSAENIVAVRYDETSSRLVVGRQLTATEYRVEALAYE
jgi:hypothetical protein